MRSSNTFLGPAVVRASFLMAVLGWGIGFYGPSIFLHDVMQRTGWSLTLVSGAVTMHYLFGAIVVSRLPGLYTRFGVGRVAIAGAGLATVGMLGWSLATAPWQLFASTLLTGAGWVTMGAVAVNAAIAPWYVRARPMALSKAYNGASFGGIVFSPLWVALIASLGFTRAALVVGITTLVTMAWLDRRVFSRTPEMLGQHPDGEAAPVPVTMGSSSESGSDGMRPPWRHRGFVTLAAGMAAGLFAQIGLVAHLYALLVPALGARHAGLAMGFATACAIGARMWVAKRVSAGADRRIAAAIAYAVQLSGSVILAFAAEHQIALILLGIALFGSGIGNATSLPPLIAQAEFPARDVGRVVARVVAIAQASYAFAPAVFGIILASSQSAARGIGGGVTAFFLCVAAVQAIAIASFLAGRRR
ncbi:MAG: MFS transporter [Burkholderiaceae bacterium]